MANNKKVYPPRKNFVTPKGVFKYPHLIEPDYGTEKYPKHSGEFNLKLSLTEDEAIKFKAEHSELIQQTKEWLQGEDEKRKPLVRKQMPLNFLGMGSPVYDDQDKETGEFELKIKTTASGKNAKTGLDWTRKVNFIDSKRAVFQPESVWGGTVGKVKVTAQGYFIAATGIAGISMYLEAVQILELVSSNSGGNADGFEDEDGGFEAPLKPDTSDDDDSADNVYGEKELPPFDTDDF